MIFQADCNEIEFQKDNYDVISVMSSSLRHREASTK